MRTGKTQSRTWSDKMDFKFLFIFLRSGIIIIIIFYSLQTDEKCKKCGCYKLLPGYGWRNKNSQTWDLDFKKATYRIPGRLPSTTKGSWKCRRVQRRKRGRYNNLDEYCSLQCVEINNKYIDNLRLLDICAACVFFVLVKRKQLTK